MKAKVEYIVGKLTPSEWSGIYGYKPDDSEEIDFFAVMKIKAESDELSLEMIGKMLFDEIQNAFFDEKNPEKDLVRRLETSAWKMKSKMDLILSREDEIGKQGLDIEMAIALIYQEYLYVGVIGESEIIIKRGDEMVELSKALEDGDMGGFLKSGSLELENEDRIMLLTSKVSEDKDLYKNAISSLNIKELDSQENKSGVAAILIADENDSWFVPAQEIEDLKEEISEVEEPQERADIYKDNSLEQNEAEFDEDRVEEEINEETEDFVDTGSEEDSSDLDEESEEVKVSLKDRLSKILLSLKTSILIFFTKLKNIRKVDESSSENSGDDFDDEEEYEDENEGNLKDKIVGGATKASGAVREKWENKVSPMLRDNNKTYMKYIKSFFGKIADFIKKVYLFLKSELVGTGDRRDYMRGNRRSRNRKIAIVVVIVVVGVLYFGLKNAEENRREQEIMDTARTNVNGLKDRYESLSSQISRVKSDSDDRKTLLISEFSKLNENIDNQKKSGLFINELDELSSKIQKSQDELLSIEAFTQPAILSDVGKTYPDADLTDIVYSNGFVFISDSARNSVYKVPTTTIDNKPVPYITDLSKPYLLVKDASGDIVFYDNDPTSSIGKFGFNEPNLTRFGQLTPSNVGKPNESVIYEGNNALYELKSINKQIFKRDKVGDTYVNGGAATSTDSSTNWRTDTDYTNGIDIAAPYEIYVLINGQGIKRYFSRDENTISFGTYRNFLKKDFDSLSKATAFDVTGRYMAVGDPVNKRVLLFQIEDTENKEITFIKQFVYRGDSKVFNDIKEVTINEQDRSVYVLDSAKVIKLQF